MEYLPLPIAALVAYYKITDIRRRVPQDHIGDTIHAMAVALSTAASKRSRRAQVRSGTAY